MVEVEYQEPRGRITPASQAQYKDMQELANLVKLLTKYGDMLNLLRREFKGESTWTSDEGEHKWIQTTKPIFIISDANGTPLRRKNPVLDRQDYIPNDEAIEELISELRLMGINTITPITGLHENEIIDDLREFEMKFVAMLTLKQVEWGLDKEMMPMLVTKIKTIVKDSRYIAKDGALLRAIMKSVQRIEQSLEQPKKSIMDVMKKNSPY